MNDVKDIVEKVKNGDTAALKALYEAYIPIMKNVCSHIVGSDQHATDDIVQEAFILAYYNINQLKDCSKFGAWCTSITKNLALKHMEKKRNQKTFPFSALRNDNIDYGDREASESALGEKEILRLIENLPKGYAKIFKLNVIEGYSHGEIAEMLGIAPHSSSSQLARAKALLRKKINKQGLAVLTLILVGAYFYKYLLKHTASSPKMISERKSDKNSENNDITTKSHAKITASTITRATAIKYNTGATGSHTSTDFTKPDSIELVAKVEQPTDTAQAASIIASVMTDSIPSDTVIIKNPTPIIPQPINSYFTEASTQKKKRSWEFLAAGSVGPALAQSVIKVFAGGNNDIGSDAPPPVIPDRITTWEDYYNYLVLNGHSIVNANALKSIALNNSGKIIEREHHDKPITFELSITKSFSHKWKIETGLRYSYLKSNFTLGEGAYYIDQTQRIQYLGIPIRTLYKWTSLKKWTLYSLAGVLLNIPMHATVNEIDVTGNIIPYKSKSHITPPLQWSIESGIGLQYDFTPKWGIYVEPSIKWYIPNGSTIHTIWTEHPFTVTVPFGIRFTW